MDRGEHLRQDRSDAGAFDGVAAGASARVGEILSEAEDHARECDLDAERAGAAIESAARADAERLFEEARAEALRVARERADHLAAIQAKLRTRGPAVLEGLEGSGATRARIEALIEALAASAEGVLAEAEAEVPETAAPAEDAAASPADDAAVSPADDAAAQPAPDSAAPPAPHPVEDVEDAAAPDETVGEAEPGEPADEAVAGEQAEPTGDAVGAEPIGETATAESTGDAVAAEPIGETAAAESTSDAVEAEPDEVVPADPADGDGSAITDGRRPEAPLVTLEGAGVGNDAKGEAVAGLDANGGAGPHLPLRYDGPLPEGAPLARRPLRSKERDARFNALLLALQGHDRAEVEEKLCEDYDPDDCARILDEVFGRPADAKA
jgi:hypothetical protein